MTEQHENRRVQMTKRLLKDALLELLEENELANISVTAICEAADVHRSTFYKYYKDPACLMHDLEQDYLDRTPLPPQPHDRQDRELILDEAAAFFDFVIKNARAFRIFFNESTSSTFAEKLIALLCSAYTFTGTDSNEMASHYALLYVANGTVGMLREWVNAGFPISSREVAEMMYRFSVRVTQQA